MPNEIVIISDRCRELASCSTAGNINNISGANVDTDDAVDQPKPVECATSTIQAKSNVVKTHKYSAILDGTFFPVVSVGDDDDTVKAICITCLV